MHTHNTDKTSRLHLQDRIGEVRRSLDDLDQRLDIAAAGRETPPPSTDRAQPIEVLREEVTGLRAELDGLRTAMVSRGIIEQAKGMLMLRLKVDEDQAFAYLRDISNRTNRRVADIAADVVRTRAGVTSS